MRQALPIVGAVVGSFFGAPQVGFMIGSLIGNAVDPQVIKGPSIGDGQATTANEGNPINLVYGTATVGGQLIDRSEVYKTIRRKRQGKGGPKVEEERFSQTFAIAIGEGPGELLSIMQDEKLVYDVRAEGRQISDEENAKYAQNFRFYRGTEDQMPDPALEGLHGVGNTPAYRGLMYIVFERFDTTDRGGSIPNFRFEVSRSNTVLQPSLITSSIDFSGTPGNYEPIRSARNNNHTAGVMTTDKQKMFWRVGNSSIYYYKFNNETFEWDLQQIFEGINTPPNIRLFLSKNENFLITASYLSGQTDQGGLICLSITEEAININSTAFFDTSSNNVGVWPGSLTVSEDGNYVYLSFTGTYNNGSPLAIRALFNQSTGTFSAISQKRNSLHTESMGAGNSVGYSINNIIWCIATGNGFRTYNTNTWEEVDRITFSTTSQTGLNTFINNSIYIRHLNTIYSPAETTTSTDYTNPYIVVNNGGGFSEIRNNFISPSVAQQNGNSMNGGTAISPGGEYISIYCGNGSQETDRGLRIYQRIGSSYQEIQYISGQYLNDTVGTSIAINAIFSGDPSYVLVSGQYYLQDIIRDIANRCKVPQVKLNLSDISDLSVRGFVVSGTYPAKNAIESLQETFFFDTAEYNERLNFIKRGHDAEITITNDDLIIDEEVEQKRESAREYPNKVNLLYQNAIIRYDKAKATAELSSDNLEQSIEKSFEVPIVFNEDEAAQVADKQLKIAWAEADGEFNFTLPTNLYDQLVPSDVFWYYNDKNDTSKRFRIIEIERADGELKVKAKTDRQSAYVSNATGMPVPVPMPPPPTIAGPTEFVYLNIPALVDQNDVLGYYVSATGSTVAYRGSEVERKTYDIEEDFDTVASIEAGTTMGYLLDGVSDASEHYSDTTNIVHLKLYNNPDFEVFQTVNQNVLLRENNAIAIARNDGTAEIIQFRDVENLGDGEYKLSYLLRGRLNSGTGLHEAGAKVVWLEDVHTVLADSSEIGDIFEHRATSFGESPENSQVYVNDYSQPLMQTEFPVDLLRYEISGSDLIISWSPRERFGSDIHPIRSQNWMGYKIEIQDGGILREYESEVPNLTVPTSTFSSSSLDVVVYQVNRFTDKGPGVQISVEL